MLRPTILAIILLGCSHQLTAQQEPLRPSFGVEYTGELQTDFERIRWVHLLQLRAELPLTRQVTFNVSSISLAHSDEEPICYDLQGYSNIEAWNIPFILSVAGFTWQMNDSHSLFAGIRRIDEDYFNSDGLALFVNSSCGGFPTIVGNFFTPAYPMASMGVHYVYDSERLGVQASLYNGIGSYEFTGRYNIFRVCPKSDGIFALAQAEYRHQNSHYFLGASVHDWDVLLLRERKLRPSVWTYAEQALSKRLTLLAAYSHAFSNDEVCNNFYGIGGRYACKNLELGLFSDYTRILEIDEWATELTCKLGLSNSLSLQPALHIIKTDNETQCIGMMRLNISL